MELTDKAQQWAIENVLTSQVARVALLGRENHWPEAHVEAAIKAVNEKVEEGE